MRADDVTTRCTWHSPHQGEWAIFRELFRGFLTSLLGNVDAKGLNRSNVRSVSGALITHWSWSGFSKV